MTHEEYEQGIRKIAEHYGKSHQQLKLMEECGELITALAKVKAHFFGGTCDMETPMLDLLKNVASEMADVEILIDQCKYLMNCEAEVEAEKERKILRQFERMERE